MGAVTITDGSWVEDYSPKAQAQVEAHGGRYIAPNTEIEKLEGPAAVSTVASSSSSRRSRTPATGYDSAEYQPQLRARQAGSLGNLILLEGL